MKRLVVLGVLCFASSASALPMPFRFPPPWYGEFLGFQINGHTANRDGLRGQCEDGEGLWGHPRNHRQQAAGMRACMRPATFGHQLVTIFSFDSNGLVRGAFAITAGDRALFEAWERRSRLEMGPPRMSQRDMRAWSAFDENRRPWYRILTFSPRDSQVAYIHIQGHLPRQLLYGENSGP